MFFTEPRGEEVSVVLPSAYGQIAIGVSVAVTVILGVLPQPLLDLLADAIFIR
jgi:NADH-quinone oxidoreductase subunit N